MTNINEEHRKLMIDKVDAKMQEVKAITETLPRPLQMALVSHLLFSMIECWIDPKEMVLGDIALKNTLHTITHNCICKATAEYSKEIREKN